MIQVIFKDLESSDLARQIARARVLSVIDRFPGLSDSRITITLSMQNSPHQAGPDEFTVKAHCHDGPYRGLTLEKSGPTLYLALAEVVDHMLELLTRHRDRVLARRRKKARARAEQRLRA